MKIKVEEKAENTLLNRTDITFLVEHPAKATPPRLDIRAKLAAILNCQEDQLYVIRLTGLYGQSATRGIAHLFHSKETAQSLERKYILKRHEKAEETTIKTPTEEKPKEEKPKEEKPKEEKPKEEKPKEKAPAA